ncbi:MAG TPA: hypothetical protein DCS09_08560 [Porphyromonadaceae bacterium]|nr:hypothetical protein [Porphyromonadaceae bacterium]
MIDGYKPTCEIRWFRADNYVYGERPLAQIAGYAENVSTWYCLKQKWVSDFVGEEDEWRDVDTVE